MKKLLKIVGIVIVVLFLIGIGLRLFFDVNQFKPTIETEASSALGRKVQIGNITLAILRGGVSVDNVVVADDPAFSHTPFLQAKKVTVGVAILPMIFSKRLEVSSLTVIDPDVSLLRSPSGAWNFSSLGAGGPSRKPRIPQLPRISTWRN